MSSKWARLARYAWPFRADFALLGALVAGTAVLEALKPWPLKLILDCAVTSRELPNGASFLLRLPGAGSRSGLLGWLTALMVLAFLAAWLVRLAQTYVQTGAGARMSYALAADLFDKLQHLSLRVHFKYRTGDLVQRVTNDAGCVRGLVTNVVIPLASSTFSLVAMFAIMWSLDRTLTILALSVVPLLVLVVRKTAGPMEQSSYEQAELQGEMIGVAEQVLSAVMVVQAFRRETHEDQRFENLAHRAGRAYVRTTLMQYRFVIASAMVTAVGTTAVMVAGAAHAGGGTLTIGSLVLFLSYLASLYQPIESMTYIASGLAQAAGSARRVLSVLDIDEVIEEHPAARPLARSGAFGIRIENLSFDYDSGSPALKNLSLDISPGETVALVGPSGSGKSTLAALLCRLYDPTSGSIYFDGIDIRKLELQSLRKRTALVLQEAFLLPVSVADNIAYGCPGARREQIVAAAKSACAHDFIQDLENGYDTILGERGATLSGGQRQRLSIARAILRDPSLLICDEPTANLDAATEAELMRSIDMLASGRTTILIAHRLSTIRRADRVLVVDRGELVEAGTERELLAAGGLYHRLWKLQATAGRAANSGAGS